MNVHKYKTDPGVLFAEGQALLKESPESKFTYRVQMVNLQLLGKLTTQDISKATGVPVRTLQHWLKSVDEKGWDSIKDPVYTGGKSRLSEEQQQEIKQLVIADKPEDEGFKVWDTKTLAIYIKRKYDVEYSQSTTSRLLHKLGFSLIRPTTYPSLENPNKEDREEYKKTHRKIGRSYQKGNGARRSPLLFADICHQKMVPEREQSEGNVKAWKKERCIQWLCVS